MSNYKHFLCNDFVNRQKQDTDYIRHLWPQNRTNHRAQKALECCEWVKWDKGNEQTLIIMTVFKNVIPHDGSEVKGIKEFPICIWMGGRMPVCLYVYSLF